MLLAAIALASALHAAPTPHYQPARSLVLHGRPFVGESFVQGNERITVSQLSEGSGTAKLDVTDLATGLSGDILATVESYVGGGALTLSDGTTVCFTSGKLGLCSSIAGNFTFTGQLTVSGSPPLTLNQAQVNTTIAAGVGATGSQTVTPGSMAGIYVGMPLLVDANQTNVESVVVTATTASTFTAVFANTHAANVHVNAGTSINIPNGTTVGGGLALTVPQGYQGSVNDPAGILEIAVPTESSGTTNVPYDIALLGSQQGQTAKAQHQIFVSSNSLTQDDLMILFGPSSQLTLTSSAPKCLTLNTGTGGTTTTPSIFIFKCNGDFTAFGNISANSTANGTGEVLTGGAGVISGANAPGDVVLGGANTASNTNGNCSGAGNACGGHVIQNIVYADAGQNAAAQTCTAPLVCIYTPITTGPTSFQLTFLQTVVNKPLCYIQDLTHTLTAITWAYTGSPITSVTATVTGAAAGDTVILGCPLGNGP